MAKRKRRQSSPKRKRKVQQIDKVLAFGSEYETKAIFPQARVTTPPWNIFEPPKSEAQKYKAVHSYFTIQRVANADAQQALINWKGLLKPGGELHINVPALEWVGEQAKAPGGPSPAILLHLFGTQTDDDYWLSAYTMQRLRQMFIELDMKPKIAMSYPYRFTFGGKQYKALQHYIAGVK